MLEPFKHILDGKKIILASNSPRRRDILKMTGLLFEVFNPTFDESSVKPESFRSHEAYVVELAKGKATSVVRNDEVFAYKKPDIVIGADTVISMGDKIYGKPKDPETAAKYLKELSGKEHRVITGVCVVTDNEISKFHESCTVEMDELSEEVIQGYIRTHEPLDKAGAYGIQGYGGSLIKRINGDYYTVVGLPLNRLCKQLVALLGQEKFRTDLLKDVGNTHLP